MPIRPLPTHVSGLDYVANIAVETELGRLSRREAADGPKLAEIGAARAELEGIAAVARVEHRRDSSALVTRRGRLDRLVEEGRDDGRMLGKAAIEHREAMVRVAPRWSRNGAFGSSTSLRTVFSQR